MKLCMAALLLTLGTVGACGDDNSKPSDAAPVDAEVDGPPGICGAELSVAGEVVDIDSTAFEFCGVFGAVLTAHGTQTHTDPTPPNGRFGLCVAATGPVQIDITPPTDTSPCASSPGKYEFPAVLRLSHEVAAAGHASSVRLLTTQHTQTFYGLAGGYDSTKAQLVVHVAGGFGANLDIDAAHSPALARDDNSNTNMWAVGSFGTDVLFPNVVGTTVTISGGADLGNGTYTIAPGTFTYVTVFRGSHTL